MTKIKQLDDWPCFLAIKYLGALNGSRTCNTIIGKFDAIVFDDRCWVLFHNESRVGEGVTFEDVRDQAQIFYEAVINRALEPETPDHVWFPGDRFRRKTSASIKAFLSREQGTVYSVGDTYIVDTLGYKHYKDSIIPNG